MDLKTDKHLPAVFSSDPSAIAAAAAVKARIESAYMMALHKPRNFNQCRAKILEACKRPDFAKEVEFDRIQGRKKNKETGKWEDNHIYGLTIRFAEVALTAWTNVLTESQMIYEDENIRRVRIAVLDLEENVCFSHDIQFTKTVERSKKKGREVVSERLNTYGDTVYIVLATAEELQNKENGLVSKTLRNEGLRFIPEDIKTEAVKLSRETVLSEDAKDPAAAKKKILDGFAGLGIWPKDIEKYLKHSLDVITPIELQQLRSIYRAVKDGEATWHSFIEPDEPEEPSPPGEDLKDKIKNGTPGAAKDLYKGAGEDTGAPADNDEAGEHTATIGQEFTNLTGIMLSKFQGYRGADSPNIIQFANLHRDAIPGWPERIRNIVIEKFNKHPEWMVLLAPDKPPETTTEDEVTGGPNGYTFCPTGGPYAGKQVSYAAACGACAQKDTCDEYALYLESQKSQGETLE